MCAKALIIIGAADAEELLLAGRPLLQVMKPEEDVLLQTMKLQLIC